MEGTVNFAMLVECVPRRVLDFWCSPGLPRNPGALLKLTFPYISNLWCVLSWHLWPHAQLTAFISFLALWQKPALALHNSQQIPNLFLFLWCPLPTRYTAYRALCSTVFDCFALISCTSVLKRERALCQVELGLNHRMADYLLCDIHRITLSLWFVAFFVSKRVKNTYFTGFMWELNEKHWQRPGTGKYSVKLKIVPLPPCRFQAISWHQSI